MQKLYFFDPATVTAVKNAVLTPGPIQKETTNAFWLDSYSRSDGCDIPEWEHKVTIMYPYVLYSEQGISVDGQTPAKYKIWYWSKAVKNPLCSYDWLDHIIDRDNSRHVDLGNFQNSARGVMRTPDSALCYMESNDGINWHRPNCGEFYYKQQDGRITGTNILFIGEHGTGVQMNTHPNAGKGEPLFLFACCQTGVGVSYSEDGIHWQSPVKLRDMHKERIFIPADTHNQLFWSSELSRYVVITRSYINDVRAVVILTGTEKLSSIRDIRAIEAISGEDEALAKARELFSDPVIALTGTFSCQPYSMPVCHLSDGYYIGIVSMANFEESSPDFLRVYASLTWSRNGTEWNYINDATSFIPNDSQFILQRGNDYGMIYCAAPLQIGEDVKIFYSATPEPHYFLYEQIPPAVKKVVDREIPKAAEANAITRTTALNIATLPKDRYAGYYSKNGTITTRLFPCHTNALLLNASVSPGGCITAAILDENYQVIPGFDHADCTPIAYGATAAPLTWTAPTTSVTGKQIALELRITQATVYTIEIV